jgi:hypothetical protein
MTFTPPSFAPMLLLAQSATNAEDDPQAGVETVRQFLDWFGAGLSEEDGEHVLDRLKDPDDPLEFEDVIDVIQGLIEEITSRPTTPSTGSSVSPSQTPSTDGRQATESTPADSIFADSST